MRSALLVVLLACAARLSVAREPAEALARNPYMKDGVVVSTNDPSDKGEGVIPGSYTPASELHRSEATGGHAAAPSGTGATGGVDPDTPIEDRIDADEEVSAKQEAYLAAKGDNEPEPCGGGCIADKLHRHRLELARARSEAHERVAKFQHPDVVAASELAEG